MNRWFSLLIVLLSACALIDSGTVRAEDPVVASPPTLAADSAGDLTYTPQWPEPPNTGAMLLRLGLGTAFVLVLCVGSLWLGKPWLQKFQIKGPGGQTLQIEGSVTLGNRAVLYLVKVGDTQLVAGTDAGGLKSLITLPTSFKEVLDEQIPAEEPVPAPVNLDLRLRAATGS